MDGYRGTRLPAGPIAGNSQWSKPIQPQTRQENQRNNPWAGKARAIEVQMATVHST
jgi:hypothetical protein